MPFERYSLKGPQGIVIQRPEEHLGEKRYHWLERFKKPGMDETGAGNARMLVRIEKMRGTVKSYDCHSPLVGLQFIRGGLCIGLRSSNVLQHGEFRACFNPYRNAIAGNTPDFVIGTSHWRKDRIYTLEYETNPWGDFLIFRERPHEKDTLRKPGQLLLLNLWAIFGMEGLHQVRGDGSLYFGDEWIGCVPTKDGVCLPFFADVTAEDPSFSTAERMLHDFQERSAARALKTVRVRPDGTSSNIFDVIGECAHGDRPDTSRTEALAWAKRAFAELFPEAV